MCQAYLLQKKTFLLYILDNLPLIFLTYNYSFNKTTTL